MRKEGVNYMNNYIIIKTLCDKEEIAKRIENVLLEKKLVAGSQISKVHSKYWWNNSLEECLEYKLEFRTKRYLFSEIEYEIKKIHDYESPEISCCEIIDASKDFFYWIDESIK